MKVFIGVNVCAEMSAAKQGQEWTGMRSRARRSGGRACRSVQRRLLTAIGPSRFGLLARRQGETVLRTGAHRPGRPSGLPNRSYRTDERPANLEN